MVKVAGEKSVLISATGKIAQKTAVERIAQLGVKEKIVRRVRRNSARQIQMRRQGMLTTMQAARVLHIGRLRPMVQAVRLNRRAAHSAKLITIRGASVPTTVNSGRTVT